MTELSLEPCESSFDIALDDEPAPRMSSPMFVDVVSKESDRRPIVPAQWRGLDNVRASLRYHTGRSVHRTTYHLARTHIYVPKALFWSVVGLFVLLTRQIKWWWLTESTGVRQDAASKNDWFTYDKALTKARAIRLFRGLVLLPELVVLVALVLVLWLRPAFVPMWIPALVVACAVPFLAHLGRPVDKPIVAAAIVTPRFRRLNADIVLRAYYAANLGHPDKPDQQVMFGSAMSRDARQTGSMVVVDLPYGKTYSDVINAKEKLASGLDVTEYQVFLTKDKTSQRRHMLFVADRDPLAVPVGKTDMLDLKPRSIWKPLKFGKDERDRPVDISMLWNSFLIGAQPRKGKTFSARLMALYAALDPYVKLIIADGKGSPDWEKFRLVAHRQITDVYPSAADPDPVRHLIEVLDEVLAHINEVNVQLRALPTELCPEGKLTEKLAHDPRFPKLRVWVLLVEEFQRYFETEDQDANKEIAQKLATIQGVGPSAGVIVISSSQKPSGVGAGDVSRLFNRYRDNHQVRFALKCGNRTVSEAVLGGDAYSEGYDASGLPVGDEYRGVGYLYGMTDYTPTVRTYLADHVDAERILTAARAYREAAGELSGAAAGEAVAREARDFAADARSVFYAGEANISWPRLAARMSEQMPEHYADLTGEAASAQLRGLGVAAKSVKDKDFFESGTGQGFALAALDAVIAKRQVGR